MRHYTSREELVRSNDLGKVVSDIQLTNFVNRFASRRHRHFLIGVCDKQLSDSVEQVHRPAPSPFSDLDAVQQILTWQCLEFSRVGMYFGISKLRLRSDVKVKGSKH